MTELLIVDDNRRDHARYRSFLRGLSVNLHICSDGNEALRIAETRNGKLDLAIVLWDMRGATLGSELLTHLRRCYRDLPVIVVNGSLDLSCATRARELGAYDFIIKPLERGRLITGVKNAILKHPKIAIPDFIRSRYIGASTKVTQVLESCVRLASNAESTILLIGEDGTGKELLVHAIHELGAQQERAFDRYQYCEYSALPNRVDPFWTRTRCIYGREKKTGRCF